MFNIFKKKTSLSNKKNDDYVFTCYSYNFNQVINVRDLIYVLNLKYESIIAEGLEYTTDLEKELEKQLHSQINLAISFKDGSYLHIGKKKHQQQKKLFYFSIVFVFDQFRINEFCNYILNSKDIYYAYITNQSDIFWQNQDSIDAYKLSRKSMKSVKLGKDVFNMNCIDISYNYGRTIYKDGISYVAAYLSWFGDIQNIFHNKDFKFALSSKELDNGLLQVQLFSNILDDYNSHRDVQYKFLRELNLL